MKGHYILKKLLYRFASYIPPSLKKWERVSYNEIQREFNELVQYIPKNGTLIDVGANVGSFLDHVIQKAGFQKAYLFEPVPVYIKFLIDKFSKNENIIINPFALSDEFGEFSIWADKSNRGWNTMISEKITADMKEVRVQCMPFDFYFENEKIEKIDFIKIDVEGFEFKVLNGMKNTLQKLNPKPVIYCEIGWGKFGHPFWKEETQIFNWLFENGYQRFDYSHIEKTQNVLFLPKKG